MDGIIYSEEKVLEFYEKLVRPIDLGGDKGLLLFLTSRGKYFREPLKQYVKSDNFFSKYLVKYNDPVLFMQAIRKLNLDPGAYLVRLKLTGEEWDSLDEGVKSEILSMAGDVKFVTAYDRKGKRDVYVHIHPPVDTMTVYIDLNPKSAMRGTINAIKQAFKQLEDLSVLSGDVTSEVQVFAGKLARLDYDEFRSAVIDFPPQHLNRKLEEIEFIHKWFKRFHAVWLSEVHRSDAGCSPYFMIDVDSKNEELLSWVEGVMGDELIVRVHTKNGYHLVYPNRKGLKARAYRDLLQEAPRVVKDILGKWDKTLVEVKKEVMVPIPGTRQAGFEVRAEYFV